MTQTLEQLQQLRKSAWKELERTHSMLVGIEITYKELLFQYKESKTKYEKADYEVALLDGRFQRLEEASSENKKRVRVSEREQALDVLSSMSKDELAQMLSEAGIELPEVEEVPEPDRVLVAEDNLDSYKYCPNSIIL